MEILGHLVGEGKMMLPAHRAEALGRYSKPVTKKWLRAFLGATGFYRRYVELLASQTAILTPLMAKQAPSKVVWTTEGERAFNTICSTISYSCALCIPLPQNTFSILTDTSGRGIRGLLQVERDGKWEAAAFYSRQLRGAEQRYSATELEALALVATIEHFSYYLYGRIFQIFTDRKPLVELTTSDRLNPRLRRMSFKLQHWLLYIIYLPGKDNTMANALSSEERPRVKTSETQQIPNICLAPGDVVAQPPQEKREDVEANTSRGRAYEGNP